MGQSRPLFCLFSFFSCYNFNTNWKKHRWCAWDSNQGPLNGRHRQNHGAMAATPFSKCLKTCFRKGKDLKDVHYEVVHIHLEWAEEFAEFGSTNLHDWYLQFIKNVFIYSSCIKMKPQFKALSFTVIMLYYKFPMVLDISSLMVIWIMASPRWE